MKLMHVLAGGALLFITTLLYAAASGSDQQPGRFAGILDEHPAIGYARRATTDRVGALATAVSRGSVSLRYGARGGYLRSLLEALDISPESQLLVFSKTGVQRASTGPTNPRALYFDDDVVVGYIPGAPLIEIAVHDPAQGVVFYTVNQLPGAAPDVSRRTSCLTCHVSGSTDDVPGLITRSNYTTAQGELIPQLGFHVVDHRTPLSQRWGGWFVTGKYDLAPYGGVTHLGNVATAMHPVTAAAAGTSNEVLFRWMDTDAEALGYASHESDIAALMVFDHQARAINLLTRLNWETRVAMHEGSVDFTRGELPARVDELVDYFLFVDEAPPPARLTPRAGFAAHFSASGPRDAQGRSLRQLNLQSRLLTYPCSYMIDSPAFRRLPADAKRAVYSRIADILGGVPDPRGKYSHLSANDRQALREILRDTQETWGR
jgi:hypothetical protein